MGNIFGISSSSRTVYKGIKLSLATVVGECDVQATDRKKLVVSLGDNYRTYSLVNINTEKIVQEMVGSGWISGKEFSRVGERIENEISEYINDFSANESNAVMFFREELLKLGKALAFTSEAGLMIKNLVFPAYKQGGDIISTKLGNPRGDEEEFCKYLGDLVNGLPKAQIVLGYELSGILRQALYLLGLEIGELSSGLSVTGEPGCGKSIVTIGLRNMLFSNSGNYSSEITKVKMGDVLKSAGICPSIFDDMSINGKNNYEEKRMLIERIYIVASGKMRLTSRDNVEVRVFSPYIESREERMSIKQMIRSVSLLDGFGLRVIELDVAKVTPDESGEPISYDGCLTKSKEHADMWNIGNGKYEGQAIQFIRQLLINHAENLLDEYEEVKGIILDVLSKRQEEDPDNFNILDKRVANRLGVIVLALKIAQETYKLDVDIDKIIDILLVESAELMKSIRGANPERLLINLVYFFLRANNNDNRLIVGKDDKKSYDPSKNLAVYEPCKGANHPGTLIVPAATAEMVFEWDWSQYEGYLDNDERPFPAIVMNIQGIDKLKDSHNYYDSVNKNRSEIGKVFDSWAKRGIIKKATNGYFKFNTKLGGEGNIACYKFDMNNAMKALGIKEDMPPETIFSQIGKLAEYNVETNSVEEVDTSHAGLGI